MRCALSGPQVLELRSCAAVGQLIDDAQVARHRTGESAEVLGCGWSPTRSGSRDLAPGTGRRLGPNFARHLLERDRRVLDRVVEEGGDDDGVAGTPRAGRKDGPAARDARVGHADLRSWRRGGVRVVERSATRSGELGRVEGSSRGENGGAEEVVFARAQRPPGGTTDGTEPAVSEFVGETGRPFLWEARHSALVRPYPGVERAGHRIYPIRSGSGWGCQASSSRRGCALTAPFHPCSGLSAPDRRYALCSLPWDRSLGVSKHPALWSAEFPRAPGSARAVDCRIVPVPSSASSALLGA